jgi:hypothetical protein
MAPLSHSRAPIVEKTMTWRLEVRLEEKYLNLSEQSNIMYMIIIICLQIK